MSIEGNSPTARKRVAIYVRSAINDQEPLEAQERICREHAQNNDWVVEEGFVRSEAGKSGMRPLEDRPALQALLRDAQRQPRPFDILMADEAEHLSRNIGDVLTIADSLDANGIRLQIVNPNLDSNDPNFRLMLVSCAISEETYKERLRNHAHKGMKGRVTMGYSTGGSYFGYRSVPVTKNGHRLGHKLEVCESEAAIVRRVFYLSYSGLNCSDVAMNLRCEEVPAPGSSKSGPPRWNSKLVRRILKNPLYVGKVTWNKTSQIIHPKTGKRVKRKNPPAMWIVVNAPELRIVSSELWDRAQQRMKTTKGKLASQEVGQPQSEQATTSTSQGVGAPELEEVPCFRKKGSDPPFCDVHNVPLQSKEQEPFARRLNDDATIDSICPRCFVIVGHRLQEADFEKAEQSHVCNSCLRRQNLISPIRVHGVHKHGQIQSQLVPIHSEPWLPSHNMRCKSNRDSHRSCVDVGSLVSIV
jgi:DNA invertase Pin-like site-specific DNA recombinase